MTAITSWSLTECPLVHLHTGCSTETALLRVYNDMLFSIDQGGGGILVLLDLSSAFDTIDHAMLFNLWQDIFGISGSALDLLKSYLDGRTQCVQIDGIVSEYAKLVCGVPQGSVLGIYVSNRLNITSSWY